MTPELLVTTIVVGLAGYALGWFFTSSELTEGWVYWLGGKTHNSEVEDINGVIEFVDPKSTAHRLLFGLFTCPICLGWWAAIALWLLILVGLPVGLVAAVSSLGAVKALNG